MASVLQRILQQPSQTYSRRTDDVGRGVSRVNDERLASEKHGSDIRPKPSSPDVFSSPDANSSAMTHSLFSSRSATTSATSLSDTPQQRPRSRSSPPAWAKDVRWLVPPEHRSRSSLLQGLELVDVEYDAPKSRPRRRMSALWEVEEDDDAHVPTRASTSPPRRRAPTRSASTTTAASTVTLPTPLPVSAGTPSTGYTSLSLPRAAYAPAKHPARLSAAVDITRSGLAQTTMSTITVARRTHARAPTDTPRHLRAALPSPLSFAAHTPPPAKVNSSQVLVQVWAVALDSLDARLLDERAARADGLGYIPGRSFVGRAVECGWDVNSVAKGDWLLGLTDVRKSGALCEFLVIDRRRVCRAPRPSPRLSPEQLALLPLAAVPAHRAVRTLAHLPRPARVLVLHAHDGPGLLATQQLAAQGWSVTAQVPGPWGSPAERRARDAGAPDVRCGHPVQVITDARADEYDAVLDTLGGKDVWNACRRVLRNDGQFTTLVGDTDAGLPTANAHFKSNMRSLRRAFAKKDHKRLAYQWVSPAADVDDAGEDVRDSLAAVASMADQGRIVPYVTAVPFERAPAVFGAEGPDSGMLHPGGTVVVRVRE